MAPDFAGSVRPSTPGIQEAAKATPRVLARVSPQHRGDSAPVKESFSETLRQRRQGVGASESGDFASRGSSHRVSGEALSGASPKVTARESGIEKAQERSAAAQKPVHESANVESADQNVAEPSAGEAQDPDDLKINPETGGPDQAPAEAPATGETSEPNDSELKRVDSAVADVAPFAATEPIRVAVRSQDARVNSGEGLNSGAGGGAESGAGSGNGATKSEAGTPANTEARGGGGGGGGEPASESQQVSREAPRSSERTFGRAESRAAVPVKDLPPGEVAEPSNTNDSTNVKRKATLHAPGNQEGVEILERADRSGSSEQRLARHAAERPIFKVVEETPEGRTQTPVQPVRDPQATPERPVSQEAQGSAANGRLSAYTAVVSNQAETGGDSGGQRNSEGHSQDRPRGAETRTSDVRGAEDASSATKPSSQSVVVDPNLKLAPPIGVPAVPTVVKPEAQSAPAEAQIVAQSVARGLAAAVNQRGGSVTLRLVPESLGLVRIHMSLAQGAVSVRLEATTPAAQGLLSEHIAMLRSSLESRGLTIEKLSVHYTPASSAVMAAMPHGSGHSSNGGLQQQLAQQAADDQAWQDAAGDQSRGRRDSDAEDSDGNDAKFAAGKEATASGHEDSASRFFGGRLRLRMETVA